MTREIKNNHSLPLGGKKIVIFGGLGFIGRNLAKKLLSDGHKVTLVENNLAGRNLKIAKKIKGLGLIKGDILDRKSIARILANGYDVLYNLAAHSGSKASVDYPFLDLETNVLGSLNILEESRRYNNLVVVFLGSRLEYGEVRSVPVTESAQTEPKTIYALSKFTASNFHLLYNKLYGVKTIVVRGANPYGPHLYNPNPTYNIINFFIDKVYMGGEVEIFESAKNQVKDYIYIDDFCEALSLLPFNPKAFGEIFNLGYGKGIKFLEATEKIVQKLKKGGLKIIKQDITSSKIEAGDFISDIGKIKRYIDWMPKVNFDEGVKLTVTTKNPIFDI